MALAAPPPPPRPGPAPASLLFWSWDKQPLPIHHLTGSSQLSDQSRGGLGAAGEQPQLVSGFLSGPLSPTPKATLAAQIPGPRNQQGPGFSETGGHKQPCREVLTLLGQGPPTWACRAWRPRLRGGSRSAHSPAPAARLSSPITHPPPSLSRAPDPNHQKPPAPKTHLAQTGVFA